MRKVKRGRKRKMEWKRERKRKLKRSWLLRLDFEIVDEHSVYVTEGLRGVGIPDDMSRPYIKREHEASCDSSQTRQREHVLKKNYLEK
jgi:hypothetical protein